MSTEPSTNSSIGDGEEIAPPAYIPEDIQELKYIAYQIILPLIIVAAISISILSVVVLNRPSLRRNLINKYFLLLASADILYIAAYSIKTITLDKCELYSYGFALYVVNVFYALILVLKTFSLYLILWISYDRFLAIWFYKSFQASRRLNVFRWRMIITLILCILIHLKYFFDVEVICSSGLNSQNDSVICDTETDGSSLIDKPLCGTSNPLGNHDYTCEDGRWMINIENSVKSEKWQKVLSWLRNITSFGVPLLLIIGFNISIIIGLLHQRRQSASLTTRTHQRDLKHMYVILAISATYIICNIPVAAYGAVFRANLRNCHGSFTEEIFRAISSFLLLAERITHFAFLCINKVFRKECKSVMSSVYIYLKSPLTSRCPTYFPRKENSSFGDSPVGGMMPSSPLPVVHNTQDMREEDSDYSPASLPSLKFDPPSQNESFSSNVLQVREVHSSKPSSNFNPEIEE